MRDDVYLELREFLDRQPGGYPETESGVELKILERIFTPEEARLTMQLRLFPEPVKLIATRWGLPETETAERLKEMARKGCIGSLRCGSEDFYQASQFFVGIYECYRDSLDPQLVTMLQEYEPNMHQMVFSQSRVVPVESSLDVASDVASYDRIREIVRKQKTVAVMDCICRLHQGVMGNDCPKPHESCLTFGVAASHFINGGKAREITIDEALRIIDRAEDNAMVIMPSMSRDIVAVCCCCSCCCIVLRLLKTYERPADHVRSAFQARIDASRCSSCEACLDYCQMEALEENGSVQVDLARCIGCGLCVSRCPDAAISLVPKDGAAPVPANYMNMLSEMARDRDRGLFLGKLNPVMKVIKIPILVKLLPYLYKARVANPVMDWMAKKRWI